MDTYQAVIMPQALCFTYTTAFYLYNISIKYHYGNVQIRKLKFRGVMAWPNLQS